ncbi:hypothetical protein Trydic_g12483, partial [Trypoxylus dichotomus]
ESQSIPTRNNYEALATDDSDVEDMQEGADDEIPENTKEKQSKENEGRNKTARPQKQEKFKHKVASIIIKKTAKWTKTSNMMKRKNITATKCKLIQTGIQVEPATELQEMKQDAQGRRNPGITKDITELKGDLQQQDYPVENISRVKGKNGQPTPPVLIEVSREYKSIYNIANYCGPTIIVESLRTRSEIVQCQKCQMFGHTQSNCNINYKCMKCGEGHFTHLCTKPKTTPPKCANCQGEHLSTYIKCPGNPNNAAVNKNFIDAPPPKVNA